MQCGLEMNRIESNAKYVGNNNGKTVTAEKHTYYYQVIKITFSALNIENGLKLKTKCNFNVNIFIKFRK